MIYEKSCGAVVFRRPRLSAQNAPLQYLIIANQKGDAPIHWGFPKGHVESGETELDTARREIAEETGLTVSFIGNFRAISHYSPRSGVKKDAIYFLAETTDRSITLQQSELADFIWTDYANALAQLTHDADKNILTQANEYLARHDT